MSKRFAPLILAASFSLAISGFVSPASALTKEQEQQAFLTADSNGDRVLSKQEFRVFINILADNGLKLAKRVRFLGVYGIGFRRTDTNKDGLLQPSELLNANDQFRDAKLN